MKPRNQLAAQFPAPQHWHILKTADYLRLQMSLLDFMNYWSLNRQDIALIVGAEISTVNRWLMTSSPDPRPMDMQTLVLLHIFWEQHPHSTATEQIVETRNFASLLLPLQIKPQEFLSHWNVTQNQLAYMCQCSRVWVSKWFLTNDKKVTPRTNILLTLGLINRWWLNISAERKMRISCTNLRSGSD